MFIKSFITIFLALFYTWILGSNIVTDEKTTFIDKLTIQLVNWFMKALIGANIVVFLYYIWS